MATETATLAGGCFWCLEAIFIRLKGVEKVASGYMGGQTAKPTYQQVCDGNTGHAEVVQIHFDAAKIRYADLLAIFFAMHDPTTRNRQGNDVGTQYRSAIFYHTPQQQQLALAARAIVDQENSAPAVTEITPASTFWPAEPDHQRYYDNNEFQPYCVVVIAPKIKKLLAHFTQHLRTSP